MEKFQSNGGLIWGLAGYGDLARRRLVEALSRPPNRLAAVWGRDPKRAQAFAERFGVPRVADSLKTLAEDVDAIYVAVPPVAHVPVALAAVEAGRHVLIEKPLSPTFDGYEKLAALVAEKCIRAAVAYYRRFAPVVLRLREILTTGQLGSLVSVDLTCSRAFNPAPGDPKAWRLDPAIAGGGVAADIGCHRLDLLCWLFGPGRLIDARIETILTGMTERVAEMTIAFLAGFSARCRCSWNEAGADRLVIHGQYGIATLDPLDQGRLIIETQHEKKIFDDPPPANLHIDLVDAFGRFVHGEDEAVCTLSQARRVDEILEAAYGFSKP
jgi:predicted dehydrogenase